MYTTLRSGTQVTKSLGTEHGHYVACNDVSFLSKREGIFLTWKELLVTVGDGKSGRHRPILQELIGYAEPGGMLAIMGPSGCGKSTLLDSLAGITFWRSNLTCFSLNIYNFIYIYIYTHTLPSFMLFTFENSNLQGILKHSYCNRKHCFYALAAIY